MDLTDNQKKALSNATKKAKLHQKNMSFYVRKKFIENHLDISYIDKIIKYFNNKIKISTRIRYSTHIFDSFIKDPKIKNKYELFNLDAETSDNYRYSIENQLFNNAYESCSPNERVKYGSFNITNKLGGDANTIMYSEINMIYKNHIKKRCTFTYADSFNGQSYICTFTYFEHLLYHMNLTDIKLLIKIIDDPFNINVNDKLKQYIELQIHGDINLNNDIEIMEIPKHIYDANKIVIDKLIKCVPNIIIDIY